MRPARRVEVLETIGETRRLPEMPPSNDQKNSTRRYERSDPDYTPQPVDRSQKEPLVEQQSVPHRRGAIRTLARLALGNKYGRRTTAVGIVLSLAVGGYSWEQDSPDSNFTSCMAGDARASHDLVKIGDTSHFMKIKQISKSTIRGLVNDIPFTDIANDNTTWTSLAALETKRRYYIDPAALARENPGLAHYDDRGKLQDKISYIGTACIADPGPQVPSVQTTDGIHDIKYYLNQNPLTISNSELKKLNPGISGNVLQVLPAGKVITFSAHPDTSLVRREMTEPSIDIAARGNNALIAKIKQSRLTSEGLTHGSLGYLPLKQTAYMINHGITAVDITAEYAASYLNVGYGQIVTPKTTKPVLPPNTGVEKLSDTAVKNNQAGIDRLASYGGVWNSNYAVMIMQSCLDQGLTPVQASGLLGNLLAENSALNPRLIQGGEESDTIPDRIRDNLGIGWVQWTSSGRQQGLINTAKQMNSVISDPKVQLVWMWTELNGGYKPVLDKLKKAKTTQEAADIVMGPYVVGKNRSGGYEDPAAASARQAVRQSYAANIMILFSGGTPHFPQ